jgi:formate hydrogenlyase subunit 3/multisubunit Na+/H+ antiporter MnhD subunit
MKHIKKAVVLASPLLLFLILFIPYHLINQEFIVKWLGCGCPIVDNSGNMIENYFSANDFTALFWLVVTACATAISVFLSKRISKEKTWAKVLYVAGMFLISLLVTYCFIQMMMWN